jgi:hypothetical protein
MPLKTAPAVAFGRVTGGYQFRGAPKVRTRSLLTAAAVTATLALSACGDDATSGSGPGNGQPGSVQGSAASAHRMQHNEGLTYAGGSSANHRAITDPVPSADFPDIDSLQCSTTGTPVAKGTIKNTTGITSDYTFQVNFYLQGQEYVGREVAKTYVQVYAVAPGETVQYETGPKPGDTTQLPPGTDCRPNSIQRAESGPDSLTVEGTVKTVSVDVCGLLTESDLSHIVGAHGSPEPGDEQCEWFIESRGGKVTLYRHEGNTVGGTVYNKSYPAECAGGEMGLTGTSLSVVCPKGGYTYTLSYPAYEDAEPQLRNDMRSLASAVVNNAP